jgi:hypothetical protein
VAPLRCPHCTVASSATGDYSLEEHLSFIVYLLVLLVTGILVFVTRETVTHALQRGTQLSMRPRLSVPRALRAQFFAPAVTGAAAMSLVGFYAALAPSVLEQELREPDHAVAGALFFKTDCRFG